MSRGPAVAALVLAAGRGERLGEAVPKAFVVLEGRTLLESDTRDGPLVAVVSETMASRYWPDQSGIGKQFGYEMAEDSVPWMTLVGVVPDPVTGELTDELYPHVYTPVSQSGISTYFVPRTMSVAVRAGVDVATVLPGIRSRMEAFDRDLPLYEVRQMDEIVTASFAGPRVTTNLLGAFAVIALLLAAVGIYGVISYSVAGRTREIGVRVALGAEGREIARLILVEGARPVVVGVVMGLAAAWASTRLVESLLFGVEPSDPLTFAAVTVVIVVGAATSMLAPAWRAARVEPATALRQD